MSLLRSLATVGGYTGISRILGFVRDILMAAVIGTGPVADAFFVAFRFPNFFRRLFAEGAFSAAFVPLFSRRLEEDGRDAAVRLAEETLSVLTAVLLALTLAAMAAMPQLMHLLAPGFADDHEKFDQAVLLTRLTFPYLLFVSLVALYGGVLNSLYKFAAMAAAPILLNVFFIATLLAVIPLADPPAGPALAWTVTAAGLAQFLALIWAARRAGITLDFPLPRLTPGVRRTLRLMGPGVASAGALQLNLVVGTIIASLQPGAVSYLYYADRVYQLPLGLIGIAFGIVLLPDLSRKLRAGQDQAAVDSLNRGIELALLLTLPATVALVAIPWPIVTVLFERGAFDAEAATATAWALGAFALGLPAYVLIKILQPGFFAREDTWSPFVAAAWMVGVNIVLTVGLFYWIGFVGIALATAIAAWVNTGLLALWLHRARFLVADARLKSRLPRIALASLLMGGALVAGEAFAMPWLTGNLAERVAALAVLVLGGMAVYFGCAVLTRAADLREIVRTFRRRRVAE
ncbi:murein biosynthesis integral membrane protein MurJ [Rhodovibrio salinarum]|uniref:Probable lipid II flippase MurJ n=1 Tax=Rhodovibrio salinarum TaxID=1087 RepID=A0A934UZD0_9PROT|nr:murein biosynthesis integral membrane protein MurJ [Rhodovibrio salinarum]MBK1697062.1 murein biosynthesis integral membrane protein MurJ [Rhodovibrio salinarum]